MFCSFQPIRTFINKHFSCNPIYHCDKSTQIKVTQLIAYLINFTTISFNGKQVHLQLHLLLLFEIHYNYYTIKGKSIARTKEELDQTQ